MNPKHNLVKDDMKILLRPICWFNGHDNLTDQSNSFLIICRRCGKDTTIPYFIWFRRLPWCIAKILVSIANHLVKNSTPTVYPIFRPVDQKIDGIGTEHSCGAYSYEHIQSLIKQYADDGLDPPLLERLVSEEGWINLEEHPEMVAEVLDSLNRGATLAATREEQEQLNRMDGRL